MNVGDRNLANANRFAQSGKPGANNSGGVSIGISVDRTRFPGGSDNPGTHAFSFHQDEVLRRQPQMILFADSRGGDISGERTRDYSPVKWDDSAEWSGNDVAFRYDGKALAVLGNGTVVRMTKQEMVGTEAALSRNFPTVTRGNWPANPIRGYTAPY
jgi:hypothetical protein